MAAIRHDLAERWPADRVRPADETPAGHRFETGTQSHEALAGFVAAVEYLAELGDGATPEGAARLARSRASARYEESLSAHALTRLACDARRAPLRHRRPGPRRRSARRRSRSRIAGATPRDIAAELGREGVFVWDGNYYALGAMLALGLEEHGGAVRAGFLHYTTLEEVDRLCDLVAAIAARG